jgi:trypsin
MSCAVMRRIVFIVLILWSTAAAAARLPKVPLAPAYRLQSESMLQMIALDPVDVQNLAWEDADRERQHLPYRFAVSENVLLTPESSGTWESLDIDHDLWRLRIRAPGVLSLNLGFIAYELPEGARLSLYPTATDDGSALRSFDHSDNKPHGELWTPVILTDDIIVELLMPKARRNDYKLVIGAINKGYRHFGEEIADKAGYCHIPVNCPEGDDWRSEINTVAAISFGGFILCSGAMINNTAQDGTPYFLTANHCGLTEPNSSSLVVYWNYQRENCADSLNGPLDMYQSGATFLSGDKDLDYTLIQLDDLPNPDYDVAYGGWDRSLDDPTSAVGIHHPSRTDKKISFEYDSTTTTSYYGSVSPGDGHYIRVEDWDLGSTEGGSSGSPLYNQDHRIVGQLSGGEAACGINEPDWYGRLSSSWPEISSYLDPLVGGAMTVDTYQPPTYGIRVKPYADNGFEAPLGGPYSEYTTVYTVENRGLTDLNYEVTADVDWLDLQNAGGVASSGEIIDILIDLNAIATALPIGLYNAQITFTNLDDGIGDTTRSLSVKIGLPEQIMAFPLDSDPGWSTEGDWAFGQPLGQGGGLFGIVDPTSGFTGPYVYGYNLAGDYTSLMPATHLTTVALDLSGIYELELRFKRWLGVESPTNDKARVSVSSNGVDFYWLWTNNMTIADQAWVDMAIPLPADYENQSTLYVRWTMGETSPEIEYCGWNIDDIEIWGVRSELVSNEEQPDEPRDVPQPVDLSLRNYPNPFNPNTCIEFSLPEAGTARLLIYDLQGRRIRSLIDEPLGAGVHFRTWDGLDDRGRRVSSGTYFSRLSTEGRVLQQKMLLLK